MGEQTLPQTPVQTQTETLTEHQSQPEPQPQPQPEGPQHEHGAAAQAADAATGAPPQNSSSSKIPFRPRKIRKVSADASSDNSDNKALQVVEGGDDNTPTPAGTTNAAGKKKTNKRSKTASAAITTTTNSVQPIRVIPRVVSRTLSCEGEIAAALRHLRAADPQLAHVIDVHPPPTFDTFHPPFLALTKSILYQQLAYKAGNSIYTRFVSLCGGESRVVPDAVLALSVHQLRQIGVSARKASYLYDLANKYRKGILCDSAIVDLDDKSLFSMLTMVKGIGSWSVHMFMIFSLHRPDVLPVADLGVRKGVQLLYGLEQLPRPSQMEQLCEKWRPYRSVASWYMWRLVESKGAPASAAPVEVGASQPQQEQQQQQQFLDRINGIVSLGACTWGQ